MKKTLIFIVLLAVHAAHALRPEGPPPRAPPRDVSSADSDSSMSSSEESSFEKILEKKTKVQPDDFVQMQKQQQQKQPEPEQQKKPKFFDRPSSEELDAYDRKVQRQNKKDPIVPAPEILRPKPRKNDKKNEADEKKFFESLGQIYLDKMNEESRGRPSDDKAVGPMGPMMPVGPNGPIGPVGPLMDYDYFLIPMEEDVPKQANNNGNGNVHVNVNHVEVNSNVLHVPPKETSKKEPAEMPPMVPYMSEPAVQSKYLYLNLNMTDVVFVGAIVAVLLFGLKKVYDRCFSKKSSVAPQLPVTLPPTYTPSHVVVETTSKKLAPQ